MKGRLQLLSRERETGRVREGSECKRAGEKDPSQKTSDGDGKEEDSTREG